MCLVWYTLRAELCTMIYDGYKVGKLFYFRSLKDSTKNSDIVYHTETNIMIIINKFIRRYLFNILYVMANILHNFK